MPALAIEAEGGDAGAAPFTRVRSALCAEKAPSPAVRPTAFGFAPGKLAGAR